MQRVCRHGALFMALNLLLIHLPPLLLSASLLSCLLCAPSLSPPSVSRLRQVSQDKKSIRMRVWERGTGITMACGTGACATAVNAIRRGYVGKSEVQRGGRGRGRGWEEEAEAGAELHDGGEDGRRIARHLLRASGQRRRPGRSRAHDRSRAQRCDQEK
eukprot:745822-Hanusia_phi.AAC.2